MMPAQSKDRKTTSKTTAPHRLHHGQRRAGAARKGANGMGQIITIASAISSPLIFVCFMLFDYSLAQQYPYYYQRQQQQQQPYQQRQSNNNRLYDQLNEPRTSAFNLGPEANYAQQHHRQQLDRNSQILSQQRSMLAQPQASQHAMMLLNSNSNNNNNNRQPQQTTDNSYSNNNSPSASFNNNNLPPSSAAITAINFNNQQQNGQNIADSSALSSSQHSHSTANGNIDCSDRLCYGLPMGCTPPQLSSLNNHNVGLVTQPSNDESCSAWITAKQIVDNNRPVARDILIELNAKASSANSWAAVGFSDNGRMKGFAFDCIHNRDAEDQANVVTIRHSFNLPGIYQNVPATVLNGFKPLRSTIENGYYGCRWIVESAIEFSYVAPNGTTQVRREDLGYKNYHILMATGEFESGSNTKAPHSDRVSSFAPVSLAQFGQLKSTASHILVRIHGSLMVIIWAGLVTSSIIIARYYKNEWANSKLNDIALWFVIHRILMLTAWFGSIIAVIFAYMYTETYHPGVHQLCGTTCLLLSTLQVVGGLLRPSLESSKRAFFNWAHFISGNLAHTFGMICLISASFLAPAHLPAAYLWVVVAFIATYAIVHIIMTIHQYVMHKSSKISITPMNDLNSNSSTTYTSGAVADSYSKGVSSPFRQFMLGIFVTLAIIFVCLLVILISNKPN